MSEGGQLSGGGERTQTARRLFHINTLCFFLWLYFAFFFLLLFFGYRLVDVALFGYCLTGRKATTTTTTTTTTKKLFAYLLLGGGREIAVVVVVGGGGEVL